MVLAPASVLTVHVGSLLLDSMREGSIVLICAVCHPKRLQWGFHSGHWNRTMMVDQWVLQNPKELLLCWGEKLTISVTLPEASEDTCNRCVEIFLSKIPIVMLRLEACLSVVLFPVHNTNSFFSFGFKRLKLLSLLLMWVVQFVKLSSCYDAQLHRNKSSELRQFSNTMFFFVFFYFY